MIRVDENNIAYDTYGVRAADCDRFNDASLTFFFSAIQEMGGAHAHMKGLSIEQMQKSRGWTWIVTRSHVDFHRIPHWFDDVDMVSWPQKGYHLNCPRVVEGYVDNELYFEAMTHWVLMDITKMRPVRPKEIEDILPPPDESTHFKDPALKKLPRWEDFEAVEIWPTYTPHPHYYDIDINKHVNNIIYTRWLAEALGEEFLDEFRPSVMDVQWIQQTYAHDEIRVETIFTEKTDEKIEVAQRIMRKEKEKEDTLLFEAVSSWIHKH